MAVRIKDIPTENVNKSLANWLESDDSTFSSSKKMSLETLLRTMVVSEMDETGKSTGTINYDADDGYECINITIDEDYAALVTGLKDHEVRYLRVDKGSDDMFSVSNGTSDYIRPSSVQKGLTTLFYRITQLDYDANSSTITLVEPMIKQLEDSAITLTPLFGSNTVTNYVESVVNDNECHFEMSFTHNQTSRQGIDWNITNWNVTKKNSGQVACNVTAYGGGADVMATAKISDTLLSVDMASSVAGDVEITISGSFIIE